MASELRVPPKPMRTRFNEARARSEVSAPSYSTKDGSGSSG
jgi:hypothetical protein